MNALVDAGILKQHLIDPVVCIRCNTCEATCPVGAITHDDRNYVVDASICNGCMACVSPCPTGSIDHWQPIALDQAFSTAQQLTWDELPPLLDVADIVPSASAVSTGAAGLVPALQANAAAPVNLPLSSTVAPKSAAKPSTNLFNAQAPARAKVTGNLRITDKAAGSDTHHVVLDFGQLHFPVLEGQNIGITPPGLDAKGRAYMPRQYSIASPRDGERAGYNNLSITVKRSVEPDRDVAGQTYFGAASNYVCDLKIGDEIDVIGPFGSTFLIPNDPKANLLMICTGTGSAPMRGFTEHMRRQAAQGVPHGKLLLFFGARTAGELPYFGPLTKLPLSLIDVNLAFSRTPNAPKQYVQDLMRQRRADVAALLNDDNTYIYVCGLKGMEAGVIDALKDIATDAGMDWAALSQAMKQQGRVHLETY
jgi:benzoyl-CoA 2,3-epoxidase subunit A